jgi:hypothetical protein
MNYATAETVKKTGKKGLYKKGLQEKALHEKALRENAVRKADDFAGRAEPGTPLDRRYGEIGISAVAAAARYQGGGKNPAYAPVANRWDDRIEEAA